MSEDTTTPPPRGVSLTQYLPLVILVTTFVVVVPIAALWVLRSDGWASSLWVVIPVAIALSLAASVVAGALWKRRRRAGDLMFSELLLWGWLRRWHIERRLANATEMLGLADVGEGEATSATTVQESRRLLAQLADSLEAQDAYTVGHSRRVARHAEMVAREMGLSDAEVERIRAAAAVHDVGKLRVPGEILNKPGRLTDDEYEIVKHHAADGAAMVACLGDPELTAIVRHHHERLDGGGYPGGLLGMEIPLGARIVAVADTFDAIIEARPYRPASPHKRALDVLVEEKGSHFDPLVVDAFLSKYSGKGAVPIWAGLASVVARGVAWLNGGRPTSRSQIAATMGVLAAIAAAALAAPLARPVSHHRTATVLPPAAQVAAVTSTTTAAPAAPTPPRGRPAVQRVLPTPAPAPPAPTSTCQAYNPQVCTVLSSGGVTGSGRGAGSSGAGGSGAGASGAAGVTEAASARGGSGGTLPFTGLDIILVAVFGAGLIAFGVLGRRLT